MISAGAGAGRQPRTPQTTGELAADLQYVDAVVDALAPRLRRECLVVGKSTVPAGTAQRIAARFAAEAPYVDLAWNPEFLREGRAVEDSLAPDRIVLGVQSDRPRRCSAWCTHPCWRRVHRWS